MTVTQPAPETESPYSVRLAALRDVLQSQGLDGFLVPLTDEHMGEYIPAYAQRLAWLSGFEGSAGLIVVLADRAAIFVDGRYTLQVMEQVSGALFERIFLGEQTPRGWAKEALPPGARVGYDPALHSVTQVEQLNEILAACGATAEPVADNPIDLIWTDQPARPCSPVRVHPDALSGRAAVEKRADVAAVLAEKGADAVVLTLLDSIAWAFNIRGGDVIHNPVTLAYAIISGNGRARLFIDAEKLDDAVRAHLGEGVAVAPYEAFMPALREMAGQRVLLDPASASAAVAQALDEAGATVVRGGEPVQALKACKNTVEIQGARDAHVRDGVAMVRFLHWLAETAPAGSVDEMSAAEKLYALRAEGDRFKGASFDTISGAGPHGAIVHYRVTPQTNRRLGENELYLVDSGGQYLDGTTDITRTVAIGDPGDVARAHYTRVLKGYVALSTARFPQGTTGHQLDAIARRPLWDAGLDYDHGTGHGVGSYLNVHEGPQRIAKQSNKVGLQPGMILSNEPGYYKADHYGIRLENLELVVARETEGDRPMLGFDTLTLAPYEREMIDTALLTADERAWIDAYHARVYDVLAPLLPADTAGWLARRTAPLD